MLVDDLVHLRRDKVSGIVFSITTHKYLEMGEAGHNTNVHRKHTTVHVDHRLNVQCVFCRSLHS